jgi:hypothetical protein
LHTKSILTLRYFTQEKQPLRTKQQIERWQGKGEKHLSRVAAQFIAQCLDGHSAVIEMRDKLRR